jgi:heat shock protein HtpX
MSSAFDRRLRLRMAATLALLVVTILASSLASGAVVLLLLGGAYALVAGASHDSPAASLPLPEQSWLLPALGLAGVLVLGLVLWGERHAPEHAVATVGATPVTEADVPVFGRTVRRVAQQLDVPMPTLYVAPVEAPLSMTTGFRPENAHLVVSAGLLELLDERELEAVTAHELAHVANRDAAVMTAAALPTTAAERVRELLAGPSAGVQHGHVSRADHADAVMTVGLLVVAPVWFAARLLAASLSRGREFVADDAAVAITGDPASLATALERIDDELTDRPHTDFRRAEVASFAIVEPARREFSGVLGLLFGRFDQAFATHPPTSVRISRLRSATRQQAQS